MKTAWRSLGAGVLLICLTVVAYWPSVRAGFVFDDESLITGNRMVHAPDGLYRFWFTADSPDYRPLTWSLWWLEWRLWDGRATGYHVVNLLLHSINCVLVWAILQRLKIPMAWLAAVLFAIHPVNVATVGWISEQKNTLSMLFYALSILLYLKFDEEGRGRWYIFSLAAFLLALLSKTAVVMLPVVLLACAWWRHGRVRAKDWLYSAPYFGASLALALVTIIQHQRELPEGFVPPASFGARLAMAGRVPWFYLSKALVPVDLMVIYPKWEIDPSRWVWYVPGVMLIGCLAVFWWKRGSWGRPLLFGLGYFVVMLFPVLGFFDQGFYNNTLVADHWQYYSIVGVLALMVGAGTSACRRTGGRNIYLAISAVVLFLLGAATWMRCHVYESNETFWRDNVAKNPRSRLAHNSFGAALARAGRLEEAMAHYEQALRLKPDYALAHNNLGSALAKVGKPDDAIAEYEQALRFEPNFAMAHYNLAVTLEHLGRRQEAIRHYEQALRLESDDAEAHYNLGNVLLQERRIGEAMNHYELALRFKPDHAEARNNLGTALRQAGRIQEAIVCYEQALQIKPDYAEAHCNLGSILRQVGKLGEAIAHYQQALRLKPDYAEARYNLAVAFQQAGKIREAIEQYQQALRLKPDYVEAHNNLGGAFLAAGHVQEAIGHFEQALRLNPDSARVHYNLGFGLEQLGRKAEAADHYEQALRIAPDFTEAQNALARLRATQ